MSAGSNHGFVDDSGEIQRYKDDHAFLPESTALYLDLYHLDAAYMAWKGRHTGAATFDLYVRSNPFAGGFMLAAGLEPAMDYLQRFVFTDPQLAYLEEIKHYEPAFLTFLSEMRFSGDIFGIREGEIAFPNEPLLRVTAPFHEALILESGLLRAIGVSTLIATKAARLTLAARGASVADFSFRRAHAPYFATRAGYIGGCDSTSFVAGAMAYDIPASGTIPHALVQAYPTELEAFRAAATALPHYSLLLDTYRVPSGIEHAITVAKEEDPRTGNRLAAVRLDSGDLIADSFMVRRRLDAAGLPEVKVLVSGDIDEYRIAAILGAGAPVDGFGVGGNLGVGLGTVDSGAVGGVIGAVYKLVWFDSDPEHPARIKIAGDKSTWPGRKQVYRMAEFERDLIALDDETSPLDVRA
ncbi:MAG: nicotinate phosphoribosyltransferase [Thermomicrobiales bacterium]|nr:nicotinate phosphoribosyltransferase [Thermomicrobiales bacterium]